LAAELASIALLVGIAVLTLSKNTPRRKQAPKTGPMVAHAAAADTVVDLKSQLASLRIEQESSTRWWRRWFPLAALLVLIASGFGLYTAWVNGLEAVEVKVVRPTVQELGPANPGVPIVTASGYLVA